MKPKDNRCEEHGMYLYRTGFGWSCKLGCYYCDDPQQIKEGYIRQYKEELKEKIKQFYYNLKIENNNYYKLDYLSHRAKLDKIEEEEQRVLKLLESEDK